MTPDHSKHTPSARDLTKKGGFNMISLELWRAKIGLFNCSRPPSSSLFNKLHHQQQSVAQGWFLAGGGGRAGLFSLCHSLIRRALFLLLVAVITHLLLSAGDVEQNPGPVFRGI